MKKNENSITSRHKVVIKKKNAKEMAIVAKNQKSALEVQKTKLVIYKNAAGIISKIFNPKTNQFLKGKEYLKEKNKRK